ncbi:MAG: anti-sigma factor family protein [Terriglobales bacterium]
MNCAQARPLFSPYIDGAVTGKQMRELGSHLEACGRCSRQYSSLRQTQHLLAQIRRPKAPADLPLKLRVAISQAVAQSRRRYLDGVRVRWQNALDVFMVPATAGLAAAVVIFVVLMGFLAPLQADHSDVPLMLHTAPQLQQSAFGSTLDSINDDSLVIEAYVDSKGRVQDYRILSDSKNDNALLPQVKKNMLIFTTFTTFRPALSMGRPTTGRAILSFSRVSVKG